MSYRDAEAAIISMAQQARPNPIGQIDDSRAQLSTRSMLVVMKLSSKRWSIRPIVVPVLRDECVPLLRRFVERENRFHGARRHARAAVDALVGMNVEHLSRGEGRLVFPRMDTINRTDVDARGILGPDAGFADDVRHQPPLHDSPHGAGVRSA